MAPTNVTVDLGNKPYSIYIEQDLIQDFGDLLEPLDKRKHAVVITDDIVEDMYLAYVITVLERKFDRVDSITVESGEHSKSIGTSEDIWQKLTEFETDRKSVVFALGGGVVGDLAGFAASTFARGIRFVNIPTTLLAQVDSSVGGKVGINLPNAKNMVGAFWQPEMVIIDPEVLKTLDDRDFNSGMAEVIKYGVIMDEPFFTSIERDVFSLSAREPNTLHKTIQRCCELKSEVVVADEKDTSGRRAILNYGHTLGHAIEATSGYGTYTHGEAISIGMAYAAKLAIQIDMAQPTMRERQNNLLHRFKLPTDCPEDDHEELLAAMKLDKKIDAGQLCLVLPTDIGNVKLVDAPEDSILLECMEN